MLFNSALHFREASRSVVSWHWGDIPSTRRFISVGASVIQAMVQLRDCSFRLPLLMEALKLHLSLHAWGTACSVVSLTHIKDTYAVGWGAGCFTLAAPFCPPSVTPVGSVGSLLPSLSQSAGGHVLLTTAIIFSLTRRQVIWKGTTLNFIGKHSYRDIAVLEDVHWCHQSVLWHSSNCRGT